MGLLDRAIRGGISKGIGDAVGKAIEKAVTPAAENYANKAADSLDRATNSVAQQSKQPVSGLESAFANLERATQGYATEMSKNIKLCPSCNEPTSADKTFCPSCGAKLPETSVADSAVCPSCGKQNSVGMKFCADCGTKLPCAVAEEAAQAATDEGVMQQWNEVLAQYPKWNCGGSEFNLEPYDWAIMFAATMPNDFAARTAVEQYRSLLMQNGFCQAGEYKSKEHLYKMVDGVCYHVDTEHCFDGDSNCPCLYFNKEEPTGGFYYTKPEPKKAGGFFDLFK